MRKNNWLRADAGPAYRAKKQLRYCSGSLKAPKQNNDTTNRDYLTISWAVLLLRPFLKRQIFTTIREDHSAHNCILNLANWTGVLTRGRLRLSEFDIDFLHGAVIKPKPQKHCQYLKENEWITRCLKMISPNWLCRK